MLYKAILLYVSATWAMNMQVENTANGREDVGFDEHAMEGKEK